MKILARKSILSFNNITFTACFVINIFFHNHIILVRHSKFHVEIFVQFTMIKNILESFIQSENSYQYQESYILFYIQLMEHANAKFKKRMKYISYGLHCGQAFQLQQYRLSCCYLVSDYSFQGRLMKSVQKSGTAGFYVIHVTRNSTTLVVP